MPTRDKHDHDVDTILLAHYNICISIGNPPWTNVKSELEEFSAVYREFLDMEIDNINGESALVYLSCVHACI